MKVRSRIRFLVMLLLVTLALAASTLGQNAASEQVPTVTFQPERLVVNGNLVYGSGTMVVRMRDSVYVSVHTSGLPPGTVATGWLAVFNDPRYCASRPCTPPDLGNPLVRGSLLGFGGQIVGPDGTADFAESRAVHDTTNAFVAGPGVDDTRRAEIQLAVRTHGAPSMDPPVLAQQLSTFNGGCPPNACATLQFAVHQP